MNFGYNSNDADNTDDSGAPKTNADGSAITDISTGKTTSSTTGDDISDINSITDTSATKDTKPKTDTQFSNGDDIKPDAIKPDDVKPDIDKDNSNTDLVEGSIIELDGNKYTVNDKGDVIDKDGAIFKEAKDVKGWIATLGTIDDSNNELSISSIKEVIGIDIVDEDGKPVEFDNTPEGIKSYVQAVNESTRSEHYQEAYNNIHQRFPFFNDMANYYVANGNSLDGYNEDVDYSGVVFDEKNETQHENIIRTAFEESGKKGNVENWIAYLKSSNILAATAKEDLQALQDNQAEIKKANEEAAEKAELTRIAKLETYWSDVHDIIKTKSIAGYQIPDNIIINKDGKKISATPTDFYNYLYKVDRNGKSAYEKELAKQDPKDKLQDDLLKAFTKFTGGSYSNLVEMAINKDKVKTLKLTAIARTTSGVKITKPQVDDKAKSQDFGYSN